MVVLEVGVGVGAVDGATVDSAVVEDAVVEGAVVESAVVVASAAGVSGAADSLAPFEHDISRSGVMNKIAGRRTGTVCRSAVGFRLVSS